LCDNVFFESFRLEFVVDEELREAIECAKKKYFSRLNKVPRTRGRPSQIVG